MIYKWKCQSLTASVNNQANVLANRTQNKCQELITVIILCLMQSSSGLLVVIAMLKEGFHFVGTLC